MPGDTFRLHGLLPTKAALNPLLAGEPLLPPTSGGKNLLVRKTEERKRSSEKGKSTEADSHRRAWLLHIVGLGILGQVNEPIKEGLI